VALVHQPDAERGIELDRFLWASRRTWRPLALPAIVGRYINAQRIYRDL
jgi:hypothetical protein